MTVQAISWSRYVDSPVGVLMLSGNDNALTAIQFVDASNSQTTALASSNSSIANAAAAALDDYFNAPARFKLTLPYHTSGTDFQTRLWQQLCRIPVGETWTYGKLATHLQSAPQAVGQALKANPIPILIPCHRIVARDGLGGYGGHIAGPHLNRKAWLLAHEGILIT